MAAEHTTHNQRRLLVGLLGVTTSAAVVLGITTLGGGGEDNTSKVDAARQVTASSSTVPAPVRSTTTTAATVAPGTSAAAAGEDTEQPAIGTTQGCRADATCPSSEHRTSDPCGAALIVDLGGYLEGRHDAEEGRPYQIDGAPAPTAADDDDDDGTVGPQTLYRAGYVQGWCDGGGEHATGR